MNKIEKIKDPITERFELLVKLGNYHSAAFYYSKRAYDHQNDFNSVLDEYYAKESVFDILKDIPGYGEYVDQI